MAQASMGAGVVWLDSHRGRVEDNVPAPQVLLQYPGGAYSTLSIFNDSVVDFHFHVERITRNIQTMMQQLGSFSTLRDYAQERAVDALGVCKSGFATLFDALMRTKDLKEFEHAMLVIAATDDVPDSGAVIDGFQAPMRMGIFLKAVPPPNLDEAVSVHVVGKPRSNPDVKATNWVLERHPYEIKLYLSDAAEGLLQDAEGHLLEGLKTNFFIVRKCKDTGAIALQTAPVTSVLGGTSRARVLDACKQLGLAYDLTAPHPRDRDTWQEAFICNALLPLQSVACIKFEAESWGQQDVQSGLTIRLPFAPGETTAALRKMYFQRLSLTAMSECANCLREA